MTQIRRLIVPLKASQIPAGFPDNNPLPMILSIAKLR